MKYCISLAILFLCGCAQAPVTAQLPIALPCPSKPKIEAPAYADVPITATDNETVVIVASNLALAVAYSRQLEKVEGCNND